jgi:hypothetical protein
LPWADGEALLNVAPLVPEMARIALDLWNHEQSWTRTAAICSGLATGSTAIPIRQIVQWLADSETTPEADDSGPGPFRIPATYNMRKVAIPRALKRIVDEFPNDEAETFIVGFLSRAQISVGIFQAVQEAFAEPPAKAWVDKGNAIVTKGHSDRELLAQMMEGQDRSRLGEIALLNCVVALSNSNNHLLAPHPAERFVELGMLLSSMGYWEMAAGDLIPLDEASSPELTEVLRGMAIGLSLDVGKLKAESQLMLQKLRAPSERLWVIPNNKQEPNWELTRKAPLDVKLLAKALQHTCELLAWNATRLLNGRSFTQDDRNYLKDQLFSSKRNLRLWGALARLIWNTEAFDVLRTRLEAGGTIACGDLYSPLLGSAKNDGELRIAVGIVVGGVAAGSPKLAEYAADALRDVDARQLSEHCQTLSKLLTHWKETGSWCVYCKQPVIGSSCPSCHIVPPSPRKHLVFLLAKANCIAVEELLKFADDDDHGVAEEARTALIDRGLINDAVLDKIFYAIDHSSSVEFLNALLKRCSSDCQRLSRHLHSLLQSQSAIVRASVIDSLVNGWTTSQDARTIAEAAICDEAPIVRSAAARSLRQVVPD